jgi:hypothetical protein
VSIDLVADTRPAIRWINYMSGREEMERTNLIGPFDSIDDRNRELARLEALPLGNRAYNGGQRFFHATMAEAVGQRVWDYEVVEPAQVAQATTQRGFHAAFADYEDEPEDGDDDWVAPVADPYEMHPDQTALFR